MSDSLRPHRRQPTRLPHPWDSPGKNTGVGCSFLRHTNNQLFIQPIFQESVLKSILSPQKFLICFFIIYQAYFVVNEKVAVTRSLIFGRCGNSEGSSTCIHFCSERDFAILSKLCMYSPADTEISLLEIYPEDLQQKEDYEWIWRDFILLNEKSRALKTI